MSDIPLLLSKDKWSVEFQRDKSMVTMRLESKVDPHCDALPVVITAKMTKHEAVEVAEMIRRAAASKENLE